MKMAWNIVLVSLVLLATEAVGATAASQAAACLPGESSSAACQLSKSVVRNGQVMLSFDKNDEEDLPLTLANASRKTLDTTTPVRQVGKKPAPEVQAEDWCKAFNK